VIKEYILSRIGFALNRRNAARQCDH